MKKTDSMKPSLWERYLTKEIGIEWKACLYFFTILFYYCTYRICTGRTVADILHMAEQIFLTYVMGYLQVFVLWNFDEADELGGKEVLGMFLCTGIYGLVAFVCKWFDGNLFVLAGFMVYIVLTYLCVFLIYKERRRIDDKILNHDLAIFQVRMKERAEEGTEE